MTKIEWTEVTFNPITGCTKITPGCANCYAETMTKRLAGMKATKKKYGAGFGVVKCHPEELSIPLNIKKPSMIFVCSMSDLFHEKVDYGFTADIYNIIKQTPKHTYQILTKRPYRAVKFYQEYEQLIFKEKLLAYETRDRTQEEIEEHVPDLQEWVAANPDKFFGYQNIWFGVSVENQATADGRIPYLNRIPGAVRYLSVEPILEEIDLDTYLNPYTEKTVQDKFGNYIPEKVFCKTMIDWMIIGCESGQKHRPCKLKWVRSLVSQGKKAKVPVFIKQLVVKGKVETDVKKFPKDLQIRQYPVKGR